MSAASKAIESTSSSVTAAPSKQATSTKPAKTNSYPIWAPRFWHGMRMTDWARLLYKNQFRVHPLRWGMAGAISFFSTFNSKMHLLQSALYGHRIQRTKVKQPPVFIIGHWRSGTTYLHELLSVDKRFASPSTYQCFAANHFLVTQSVIPKLFWFAIPGQRPMDNVKMGWDRPQEDEFALCAAGIKSPYFRIAFPNHTNEYLEYLDMKGLTPKELNEWKKGLTSFIQALTLHQNKRIVLKSPTHTGRLKVLSEMFPGARFLHIVRDPYVVVPSTMRLWKSLDEVQGLQVPKHHDLEDYIFRAYDRMYGGFRQQIDQIADHHLHEVKYEELVQDPVGTVRSAYDQLQLDDFSEVESNLQEFVAGQKDYRTNSYTIPDSLREKIDNRWGYYLDRYGYRSEDV